MSQQKIPNHVDDPQQFLMWSIDEVLPLMIAFVVGFMLEQVIIFTFLGLMLTKFYRRYRDSKPDGYLRHWLYWYGIGPVKGKTIKNPFEREFYE